MGSIVKTLLRIESVGKSFPARSGTLEVLRDVSLTLGAGESIAIMGSSGSGKSTLLNTIGTLDTPTSGAVTLDGSDPFALPERELARFRNRRVGFIFQEHHLLPQLSVLENVLIPTLAEKRKQELETRKSVVGAFKAKHKAESAAKVMKTKVAALSGNVEQIERISRELDNLIANRKSRRLQLAGLKP